MENSGQGSRPSANLLSLARSAAGAATDNCAICHETLTAQTDNPLVKLRECSHKLHKVCIIPWFRGHDTCPICRDVVASYVELNAEGQETGVPVVVPRREHNYPSPNSFVFLPITEEVSISYLFMADAFILRTGGSTVEFLRTDRIPARVQFTVAPNNMVPLYHLIIVQARNYILKIGDACYNLETLLTSISRRMSLRRQNAILTSSETATERSVGSE